MKLSPKAKKIHSQIKGEGTKLRDLRKLAKEIKKDQALALELWSTGAFFSRQLAILIMDKKLLTPELVDRLSTDIESHDYDERTHLADWLMANQLTKGKPTIALLESWMESPSVIQRRLFWYYQARLRWTGQTPPDNTEDLLSSIEKRIEDEEPEVQWAMNFTAGQIGIFDEAFRSRCVSLGKETGPYKDEVVAKGCTPNYLPRFIAIQVEKVEKSRS
jgi:3-methyladenine DNA glycosylase AlkD